MFNRPIILANWKMNLSVQDSLKLAKQLVKFMPQLSATAPEVVLCPSLPALSGVGQVIAGSAISLGAQNVFWQTSGSYTGEVSPVMLKELGVKYVIVGHSERRQWLNETPDMIKRKVWAVLNQDLVPVLCVGETFNERQTGRKDLVVMEQLKSAVNGLKLKPTNQLIVAYEPVWVIGSGQAVAHEEMVETAKAMEQVLVDLFSVKAVREQIRIIYGGSVDQDNINICLQEAPLQGVLVGGASLQASSFEQLLTRV